MQEIKLVGSSVDTLIFNVRYSDSKGQQALSKQEDGQEDDEGKGKIKKR